MDYYEVIDNTEIIKLIFTILTMLLMGVATVMDIREKKIPISLPAVQMMISMLYFIYLWSNRIDGLRGLMLSMLPGAALLLVGYVTKQGIGFGDGFMVLALGPLFGAMDIMLITLIAFSLSALTGGMLLLFKKAEAKNIIAFMPFLTVGVGVISFAAA